MGLGAMGDGWKAVRKYQWIFAVITAEWLIALVKQVAERVRLVLVTGLMVILAGPVSTSGSTGVADLFTVVVARRESFVELHRGSVILGLKQWEFVTEVMAVAARKSKNRRLVGFLAEQLNCRVSCFIVMSGKQTYWMIQSACLLECCRFD